MKCTQCGNEILQTDRFCGICGAFNPLSQAPAEPEHVQPETAVEHAAQRVEADAEEDVQNAETEKAAQEAGADEKKEPDERRNEADSVQNEAPEPVESNADHHQRGSSQNVHNVNPTAPHGKDVNTKRTCSLSVAVFCGIVIFLLSILCGIFAGLYFSGRDAENGTQRQSAAYIVEDNFLYGEYRESLG